MNIARGSFSLVAIARAFRSLYQSEGFRRQPLSCVCRVLRWQIYQRCLGRPLIFESLNGVRMKLMSGYSHVLSGYYYYKLPDFEETAFALHLLRDGELFVDIGANQGARSLIMAGGGFRTVSFEPVPLTRRLFEDNRSLNTREVVDRIAIRGCALGEDIGEVAFTSSLDGANHRLRAGDQEDASITVPMSTLDFEMRHLAPRFLKIDVEGQEKSVIQGAAETLSKEHLWGFEMETFRGKRSGDSELLAMEALFADWGFLPYAYNPYTRSLHRLAALGDGGQNTLYIRERSMAEISRRLKSSPGFRIWGRLI
jgi:methyltransferase, FkbM family